MAGLGGQIELWISNALSTPLRGSANGAAYVQLATDAVSPGTATTPLYVQNTSGTAAFVRGRESIGFTETTAVLAGAGTYVAGTRDSNIVGLGYCFFVAEFFADQAGTCYVEKSNDAGTFYPCNGTAGTALTAGQTITIKAPLVARYYRVRYLNGATLQGVFDIQSNFTLN